MPITYGLRWALHRHRTLFLVALAVALMAAAFLDVAVGHHSLWPVAFGAIIVGQRFTYSDTVNEKIDISSALDSLRATDVPLLTLIGRDSLRDPAVAVKHEWLEYDLRGQVGNLSDASANNTTNPVAVNMVAGDDVKFRVNDIVRVTSSTGSEEICRITVVTFGANIGVDPGTITLSRGWGGGTIVAHASGATVTLVAPALPQGSDPGLARTAGTTNRFNYTQIFEEDVVVSATEQATAHITRAGDPAQLIADHLEIIGTNMEKTLLFGRRSAPGALVPSTMAGLRATLSTNVYDKAGAALTETMLSDALQDLWNVGAKAMVIVVNSIQKRRIDSFMDPFRMAGYTDTRFGSIVSRYVSNFGDLDILMDRWMPTNEVLILNPSKIGFGPLSGRSLSVMKLPPPSKEYDKWQISGEYTAEVRLEKSHAWIKNLATTGLF